MFYFSCSSCEHIGCSSTYPHSMSVYIWHTRQTVGLRPCFASKTTSGSSGRVATQHVSACNNSLPHTPTKAALGHSRHADAQDSAGKSAHATALQNFKPSKFVHHAKHKVDDSKPGVMDTIRPVKDVRINGKTQAALVVSYARHTCQA